MFHEVGDRPGRWAETEPPKSMHQQSLHARRYTHMLGDKQWAYNDWLADACGPDVERLPEWRPLMYKVAGGVQLHLFLCPSQGWGANCFVRLLQDYRQHACTPESLSHMLFQTQLLQCTTFKELP